MQSTMSNRAPFTIGRIAVVVLLMALVLALEALVSSPALHLRLCPNANRPGHHCAVTDFAAGLAEVPVAMAGCLAVLMVMFEGWISPEILHRAAQVHRLSPARAPPV